MTTVPLPRWWAVPSPQVHPVQFGEIALLLIEWDLVAATLPCCHHREFLIQQTPGQRLPTSPMRRDRTVSDHLRRWTRPRCGQWQNTRTNAANEAQRVWEGRPHGSSRCFRWDYLSAKRNFNLVANMNVARNQNPFDSYLARERRIEPIEPVLYLATART
jgi:hypothetical protein